MKYLIIYLAIINAVAFLLMLADKQKARKNAWRIPERTLLLTAAIGGSFGSLLGMCLFRHKTRKPRFSLGIPLLFTIHSVILIMIIAKTA
jgi:uncharacterized membrane protein YsdA (DUF1294 family)